MISGWFMWFIIIWCIIMVAFMAIGGFFMFRKFLKKMPKNGGASDFEIEVKNVEQTKHLWGEKEKSFLEDLVSPVPELFRDVARMKIAGKIGELALEEQAEKITEDLVIRGYIIATPKRDHKFLLKKLREKQIDLSLYESYLQK